MRNRIPPFYAILVLIVILSSLVPGLWCLPYALWQVAKAAYTFGSSVGTP